MKVLVGMPAYKLADVVETTIMSMLNTPADVLVVDNSNDESVKQVIRRYPVSIISNDGNRGCNGAWNQILYYGIRNGYDIIGLNTDAALLPGWYDKLIEYMSSHPKEVVLANTGRADTPTHLFEVSGAPLSFYPREAAQIAYPIPPTLIHWFGDTYMFVKLRELGWRIMVLGPLRAQHDWSRITSASPEVSPIIPQDKAEWRKLYPHIIFE